MSDLTLFASTYNLNTRGSSVTPTHLQHWLKPAFSGDDGSAAPDLVVIGVQELIPLHQSRKLAEAPSWIGFTILLALQYPALAQLSSPIFKTLFWQRSIRWQLLCTPLTQHHLRVWHRDQTTEPPLSAPSFC